MTYECDVYTHYRIHLLKAAKVLQPVHGHLINASNGVIVCGCGDCDRRDDYAIFLRNAVAERMHYIMLNGGALLISPNSPLHTSVDENGNVLRDGAVMRSQIRSSVSVKGINKIALVAHYPCGAATAADMNVDDVVRALYEAKAEIKARYPNFLVACFLSVDWRAIDPSGDKEERTYFMSRANASRWLERNFVPEPVFGAPP